MNTLGDDLATLDASVEENTLLARLRAQRATRTASHLDIVIPEWSAPGQMELIARMKRIPWNDRTAQAMDRLGRAVQGTDPKARSKAERDTYCDLLIAGVDQLYVREADAEPYPVDDDQPMRFDKRLAEHLGVAAATAREVVYGVFGGALGEWALRAAANSYFQWLSGLEVVTVEEGKD